MVFFFDACTPSVCEALTVVDDDKSERVESFYLTLERTSDLDSRIILNRREGEVTINDDDGKSLMNVLYAKSNRILCNTLPVANNFHLYIDFHKLSSVAFVKGLVMHHNIV